MHASEEFEIRKKNSSHCKQPGPGQHLVVLKLDQKVKKRYLSH